MREAVTAPMILTECTACADERAAGATFCEVCGRALTAEVAEQPSEERMDCPHCKAGKAVGEDGYCEECGLLAGRARDHLEADGGTVAAAVSNRGRRHHRNEDAMWLAVGEAAADVVVADGVSASYDPDAASEVAAKTAGEFLAAAQHPEDDAATGDDDEKPAPAVAVAGVVAAAIAGAAEAVAALAHSGDPRRSASNPACTIVAAAVRGPHVGFGWIGDSRAYWLREQGPAEQLTEDDSWARHVIALGVDPQVAMNDPKAHAITAWLGADAGPVRPRVGAFTVTEPGHLVLCSDGLWNYLTDPAVFADVVRAALTAASGPSPLLAAARALVAYANDAGGADNITVALVPVRPTPDA
ncbi:protein phosphatase 2C domain-containing protein [Actinoplanes sp. NPDC024001]|uniref:PP2C family protein-serine/threonine phosphatase n=1 Tax=Actinoplanes sp. NPDC024001 TaxID=3154598 RepID=UPI0033FBF433